jgi:hypothetical protein
LSGLWRWLGRRCGARPSRIALLLVAAAVSEAHAQSTSYFAGHSHSWGARAFVFCDPSGCVDAVEESTGPLTSMVVGVERRFWDAGRAHVASGVTIARRGWYEGFGRWNRLTTASVPLMLVAEPLGPDAPIGIGIGGGLSADLVTNRLSVSRLSLVGGVWGYARLTSTLRLSLGVRTSRTLREIDGLFLRSNVVSVGIAVH